MTPDQLAAEFHALRGEMPDFTGYVAGAEPWHAWFTRAEAAMDAWHAPSVMIFRVARQAMAASPEARARQAGVLRTTLEQAIAEVEAAGRGEVLQRLPRFGPAPPKSLARRLNEPLRDQGFDAAGAGRLLAELRAEAAAVPTGIRLAAGAVDMAIIIGIVALPAALGMPEWLVAAAGTLSAGYLPLAEALTQRTAGKALFRLVVSDRTGEAPSGLAVTVRAFARSLYVFSLLARPFGLPWLHDALSGTKVVRQVEAAQ